MLQTKFGEQNNNSDGQDQVQDRQTTMNKGIATQMQIHNHNPLI